MPVFWDVALCWVRSSQHFEVSYFLILHGHAVHCRSLLGSEDARNKILRKDGNLTLNDKASHSGLHEFLLVNRFTSNMNMPYTVFICSIFLAEHNVLRAEIPVGECSIGLQSLIVVMCVQNT